MLRAATLLATALMLLALGLLSAPTAFAQGPGDDQYTDPFGEVDPPDPPAQEPEPPSDQEPSPPSGGGGGGDDGTTSAVPDETADTSDPTADATTSGETAGTGEELARTGLPAGLLAALGLTMLASGGLLRLTLAPHDARLTMLASGVLLTLALARPPQREARGSVIAGGAQAHRRGSAEPLTARRRAARAAASGRPAR